MKKEPFLYQKLRGIFNKHTEEGTPRKMIEANMAREFRLCREEVRRVIEEMHLENDVLSKKRVKREAGRPEYHSSKDQETYLEDLRASR